MIRTPTTYYLDRETAEDVLQAIREGDPEGEYELREWFNEDLGKPIFHIWDTEAEEGI